MHALDETISPPASLAHPHITVPNLALHNDAGNHGKCVQPAALHDPGQRVVDRTRVGEARIREIQKEALGASGRESICVRAQRGVRGVEAG
jgi:hypothetical protein